VHDMVLDDRRMKVREITGIIGISWTCSIYFAWRIRYEKALLKMGATLVYSR
jgi:hypothetical protein